MGSGSTCSLAMAPRFRPDSPAVMPGLIAAASMTYTTPTTPTRITSANAAVRPRPITGRLAPVRPAP